MYLLLNNFFKYSPPSNWQCWYDWSRPPKPWPRSHTKYCQDCILDFNNLTTHSWVWRWQTRTGKRWTRYRHPVKNQTGWSWVTGSKTGLWWGAWTSGIVQWILGKNGHDVTYDICFSVCMWKTVLKRRYARRQKSPPTDNEGNPLPMAPLCIFLCPCVVEHFLNLTLEICYHWFIPRRTTCG